MGPMGGDIQSLGQQPPSRHHLLVVHLVVDVVLAGVDGAHHCLPVLKHRVQAVAPPDSRLGFPTGEQRKICFLKTLSPAHHTACNRSVLEVHDAKQHPCVDATQIPWPGYRLDPEKKVPKMTSISNLKKKIVKCRCPPYNKVTCPWWGVPVLLLAN